MTRADFLKRSVRVSDGQSDSRGASHISGTLFRMPVFEDLYRKHISVREVSCIEIA